MMLPSTSCAQMAQCEQGSPVLQSDSYSVLAGERRHTGDKRA
ncbi:hypothetical protein [Shewanella sp. M16]|nr:hypothetical protein [Shewanella sp. M16]